MHSKKENGFTLVELAIVLMIIGLLIGGVLRGQELVKNARVSALIKQVTSYDAAINTFLDSYGAYPGDMSKARARLPGCTDDNSCLNGDADGMVGGRLAPWDNSGYTVNTEPVQFWKHLALSHMVTGIDPAASLPAWGKTQPYSPFAGGFSVVESYASSGSTGGLLLRLHGCLDCSNVELGGTVGDVGGSVSPAVAYQIDRKMDDGIPNSGSVQAAAHPYAYGNFNEADCETRYNAQSEIDACVMNFALHR